MRTIRNRALSKLNLALKILRLNNFAIKSLRNSVSYNNYYLQINYETFCELIALYIYGGIFLTPNKHHNHFFNALKNLKIIEPFRHVNDTHACRLVDSNMDTNGFSMTFAPPVNHVSKDYFMISKPVYRCLKDWHLISDLKDIMQHIDRFINIICASENGLELYQEYLETRSVMLRSDYTRTVIYAVASEYFNGINNLVFKAWKQHDTNLLDFFKDLDSYAVYRFAKRTSYFEIDRFLECMWNHLFGQNPKYLDSCFNFADINMIHQDYARTLDFTKNPYVP